MSLPPSRGTTGKYPIAARRGVFTLYGMNAPRLLLPVLLALTVFQSQAAKPVKFAFTFRGTVYQTNGLGQVVASRITEQDLLQAAMTYYQVTDPNAAVLAYCITNNHFGDTISLINA